MSAVAPVDYLDEWKIGGACRHADPAIFFDGPAREEEAFVFCTTCPVEASCLDYALAHRIDEGIWGGMTSPERRRVLRIRRRDARGE